MSRAVDDDDSDLESEEQLEWLLGFADPPRRPSDLLRHRFPSKIGGRPAWLDPLHLPIREQLTCKVTGHLLQFLIQVYAPVDENPTAFHRAIFVFISPDGSTLTQPGAVRAFRCQLPRRNQFYGFDPATKSEVAPPPLGDALHEAALASDPWQVALHESPAASSSAPTGTADRSQGSAELATTGAAGPALLPEAELVVEPEPGPSPADDAKAQQLLEAYRQRTAVEGEYDEDELPAAVTDTLEANVSPEQRHFAAFAARIAKDPEQVLRYCFEDAAEPVCPSPAGIPGPADIPPCPRCGTPRRFEFQVMPQLINHLGVDASDPHAPDWGTIAVYSCSASCGGSGDAAAAAAAAAGQQESSYVEEHVWVQPSA